MFGDKTIFDSSGMILVFPAKDKDLHDAFIKESKKLENKYYRLLRKRNGIYATNQGKYVSDVSKLNDWDSRIMEERVSRINKRRRKQNG